MSQKLANKKIKTENQDPISTDDLLALEAK